MSTDPERKIRRAALCVLAGLGVQLICTLYWSPLMFVLFVALGAPLVLLGVILYLAAVWRILVERRAL